MARKTATDLELGQLHSLLARSMQRALTSSDKAAELLDEFIQDLPQPVIEYLQESVDISPALMTAVSKFLKDNAITCAIEDSEEMTDLQKRLANKTRRKRVGNVEFLDEE